MTLSVGAFQIELARRKGAPLPPGWAVNEQGKIETDAEIAYSAKRLMPVGGAEETSGYKGYGLGCLVEIFCGILSGSNFGPHIRAWGSVGEKANLGQCFIAINPKMFADGFEDRMSGLMNHLRCMEPVSMYTIFLCKSNLVQLFQADPSKPVLVAGDPERAAMERAKREGGLVYVKNQHDTNLKLAQRLSVKPMESA